MASITTPIRYLLFPVGVLVIWLLVATLVPISVEFQSVTVIAVYSLAGGLSAFLAVVFAYKMVPAGKIVFCGVVQLVNIVLAIPLYGPESAYYVHAFLDGEGTWVPLMVILMSGISGFIWVFRLNEKKQIPGHHRSK